MSLENWIFYKIAINISLLLIVFNYYVSDLFPQNQTLEKKRKFSQQDVRFGNSKKQKFTHSQDLENTKESRRTNINFKQNKQRHKSHNHNVSTTKSSFDRKPSQKHKRVMGSKVRKGQRHR